jgi:pimeloyl-ACP methyl ester carboxylesterase
MGGIVAQQLALRHPQLVRSLQLHSTWGSADCQLSAIFHSWKTYAEKVPQLELFRQIWLWVYTPRWYRENPQELAEFERLVIEKPSIQNSKGFCDQAEACISHNALDQLSTIAAPTLITGGDCDTLVPQRHAHELKRRIPDALLHIWPQMGHAPFWEIADDFNSLCVMFAKAHEGKAGNYLVERVP